MVRMFYILIILATVQLVHPTKGRVILKFIHCSDLHLDSKMETNLTKDQAKARRYELLSTFERMVDYAKENEVRAILISGDLFDTDKNKQKRMKDRVLEVISEAKEVDFLYLQGNHDQDDFFQSIENLPSNLKLFGYFWGDYTYGNVNFTGISLCEANSLAMYDALFLREECINIVALHGQAVSHLSDDPTLISLPKLQNKNIDYLALGHLHQHKVQPLDRRGEVCYSGCLEGRGFDECGEKGFVLLEVGEDGLSHSFVPFAKRTIHEVCTEVEGNSHHLLRQIEEKISELSPDDYLRVVLVGQISEEIDTDYLTSNLQERFYCFKLVDRTEIAIDYTRFQNDISLKGEYIRTVLALELPENQTNRIILMGLHALEGREIS